jgi:hypothetical protein
VSLRTWLTGEVKWNGLEGACGGIGLEGACGGICLELDIPDKVSLSLSESLSRR